MDAFPVEVMQEILQNLRPDFTSPTIGEDAVWTEPKYTEGGFSNWWSHKTRGPDNGKTSGDIFEPNLTSYRDILPLRLWELNLIDRDDEVDYEIAAQYGRHIKLLRVGLIANASESHETGLAKILSLCRNLQSIGLYYRGGGGLFKIDAHTALAKEFLSAIRYRGLHFIGFYCRGSYCSRETMGRGDQHLLYDMTKSDESSLESLTIRGSLSSMLGPLWKDETKSYWGTYSNLTRLQLIDCGNVYPPHIAELIRHFPSLEYFLISACGHGPSGPHGREKGWSSQPSGWWNQRKPLKLMHIEHMLAWEMLVMGTIPALEIRAVSLYAEHLATTFIRDHEVFPYLKLLRAAPLNSEVFGGGINCEAERGLETDLKA
ncbi:2713_t:CDS:2, partial [Acaulospora colombiana]